jgi:hypothetical protein
MSNQPCGPIFSLTRRIPVAGDFLTLIPSHDIESETPIG